ncbi:substrate-binding protein [Pseudofrankia sp. BMG5.37]|uniref:substrate-binding protein n=1 Tax=Pseudofrankia sp. BMG5.37 TaxID=3050035 RepID=UPI0028962390|nr:substrate-binding protein [Pseudofrankia sp. BMG5.37]MDT3441834.1 substrate-binding protein [Pseudofrankia sp. BMG5.37]
MNPRRAHAADSAAHRSRKRANVRLPVFRWRGAMTSEVLRRGVLAAAAGALALVVGACSSDGGTGAADAAAPAGGSGEITVGLLTTMTGPAGLFGPPTKNVAELAIDEINAAGGVGGRKVRLVVGDDAGNPDTGKQVMRRLVQSDGASVVVGMHNSATREAALPVAVQAKTLYLYTPVFEGGACNAVMFANGEVPSQQLAKTIPWVMQQTGKKRWYLLGNDYVWPRKSFEAAKRYITAAGGEVVGEDYTPLGTTDFQSVIQKVQKAGPDLLLPALVGGDGITFEKQAYDAGLGNDEVQRLSVLYEDNTRAAMGARVAAGMYTSLGYFQEVDNPTNTAFLAAYRQKFGADASPVTSLSEQTYVAIKAWAQAANAAGGTDVAKVTEKLKGMSLDAPAGKVTFGVNRYATQPIYIAQTQSDGTTKIVQTYEGVTPEEPCDA